MTVPDPAAVATADWVKYVLTCFGGAMTAVGGVYGLMLHRQSDRIDSMNMQVHALIAAAEERIQGRVESRHGENLAAFIDHRREIREGNAALLAEVKDLRSTIADDRRREIDRLLTEIRSLQERLGDKK